MIETSMAGASFTGLAIGNSRAGAAQSTPPTRTAATSIPSTASGIRLRNLHRPQGPPSGFTAFNVQNLNGILYVTFANPNNPLGGVVDEFKTDGTFIKRLIDDAPAPSRYALGARHRAKGWGQFGGDLLVGNNDGDGTINAYTLGGVWQGQLTMKGGQTFSQGELWGMTFGTGGGAGSPNVLYFAAGLDGATNGLVRGDLLRPRAELGRPGVDRLGVLTGGWRWKNRRRRARS